MSGPPRDVYEPASVALARAEVDPDTRERITYAHEIAATAIQLAGELGLDVTDAHALRLVGPLPLTTALTQALRASGLTLGEARAAGVIP